MKWKFYIDGELYKVVDEFYIAVIELAHMERKGYTLINEIEERKDTYILEFRLA